MSYTPPARRASIHTDACNAAHKLLPLTGDAARDLVLVQAFAECHAFSDSHPAVKLANALRYEALQESKRA